MTEEIKPITLDNLIRATNDPTGSGPLVYVAAPYTHADEYVQDMRMHFTNRICALLFQKGICIYSPLSHSVPIAKAGGMKQDWDSWRKLDLKMVYICDLLLILPFEGWKQSTGVKAEHEQASRWQMRTFTLDLAELREHYRTLWIEMKIAGLI